MRYPEPRVERRRRKRAEAAEKAEARIAAAEPRKDERRQEQRRADPPLEGEALDRRLRELGISENRRRAPGDRRDGGDRRRR